MIALTTGVRVAGISSRWVPLADGATVSRWWVGARADLGYHSSATGGAADAHRLPGAPASRGSFSKVFLPYLILYISGVLPTDWFSAS